MGVRGEVSGTSRTESGGDAVGLLGVGTATGALHGCGLIGRRQRVVTVTPDMVTLRVSPTERASEDAGVEESAVRPADSWDTVSYRMFGTMSVKLAC